VSPATATSFQDQKRHAADRRKRERALKNLRDRIADLETRIAEHERAIKDLEAEMAAPGFYSQHEHAKSLIDKHQALMWQVGELLSQWEMLQGETEAFADLNM
jgi:ATP-binding cassette subfamily F protein 3